jgi:hypothetical protein
MISDRIMLPVSVGLTVVPWLAVMLFPAWSLKHEFNTASAATRARTATARRSVDQANVHAYARRLRAHPWTTAELTAGIVVVTVTIAALLALLAASNVVGLERTTFGERWLPWILGIALMAVIAECWPDRGEPKLMLRICAVGFAFLAIVSISVMKAEASTVAPTQYIDYHPMKDLFLGPFWITLELAYALAAASLGRPGIEHGVRLVGWLGGLAIEVTAWLVGALVIALGALVALSLTVLNVAISTLFLPAALLWGALRRAAGTDIDGNDRLGPLPGPDTNKRNPRR